MTSGGSVRIEIGGASQVCCVHDREKRIVRTDRDVFDLGLQLGLVYDPKQHKTHLCSCCENLFVDPSDEPRFCGRCMVANVHELGGPLPVPRGVVDGC